MPDLVNEYDKMRLSYSKSMKEILLEVNQKSSHVGINFELESHSAI